jgi:hypothetical protein
MVFSYTILLITSVGTFPSVSKGMFLNRPIHFYHSRADLIWTVCPFNSQAISRKKKKNRTQKASQRCYGSRIIYSGAGSDPKTRHVNNKKKVFSCDLDPISSKSSETDPSHRPSSKNRMKLIYTNLKTGAFAVSFQVEVMRVREQRLQGWHHSGVSHKILFLQRLNHPKK